MSLSLSVGAITLSGLTAANHRMAVSSDNLSRLPVPNSGQNRVVQSTGPNGGVSTSVKHYPVDPGIVSDTSYISTNIDVSFELIEQSQAKVAYESSMAVYNIDTSLEEEILNIKA